MSLTAVALDIEATGLDAATARVIEISAIRLDGQEVNSSKTFHQFINPGVPIPETASLVHGLTARDLRGAPAFAHVTEALDAFVGSSVVIGHNIGYDLAVIDHEFRRLDRSWKIPACLDVRVLARLVAPNLAGYSLETLCDWLGVDILRRHRAFPDALAAAQVFVRLVPLLRDAGVRTLAEAEAASSNLPGEERLHRVAGWISPDRTIASGNRPAATMVETYPFRHRVRDAVRRSPVFVQPSEAVERMAELILEPSAGGVLVVRSDKKETRLITQSDLLRVMSMPAAERPRAIAGMKLAPCSRVTDDDFLYRALARMQRLGTDYLCVENRRGEIVGVLSAADLLSHRATAALALGDEIESAESVADLGRAWARLPSVVESLLREMVNPEDVAGIISAEIRALTARAAHIAEARMVKEGRGPAPVPYAVLVLGSAGRGDSLMNADQDNAYVYSPGEPDGPEDHWFAAAGAYLTGVLHEVGIRYCEGGVMASSPSCRLSTGHWKEAIAGWIGNPGPEAALASDIFFDGVPVHGDFALAGEVMDFAYGRAAGAPQFVASLAAMARQWQPPVKLFGRLQVDGDGRLDLKRNGLLPITTLARALALKHGIRARSTISRLTEVKARGLAEAELMDKGIAGFRALMKAVLDQQIADSRAGVPISSRVEIAPKGARQKAALVEAIKATGSLIAATYER